MNKTVTVQDMSVLLVAFIRAAILGICGLLTGVVGVLVLNSNASIRQIIVGALIIGIPAFVARMTEGLVDQGRASVVDAATPVGDVIPGTKP